MTGAIREHSNHEQLREIKGPYLEDAAFCRIVIAIMVERLGNHVTFTQADFDAIRFRVIKDNVIDGGYEIVMQPIGVTQ